MLETTALSSDEGYVSLGYEFKNIDDGSKERENAEADGL